MNCEFEDKVFTTDAAEFDALALEIFRFQARYNKVYAAYINALGLDPLSVRTITEIPFLPISFFKLHPIVTGEFTPEVVFESSGTTGMINSRHEVRKLSLYRQSFQSGFELFYGPVKDWCVIGLLPSYLERQHSSLVLMVDEMIRISAVDESGFYLYNVDQLADLLIQLEQRKQKTLLIGVSFALVDFAERYKLQLEHTIVMETGGMKGRRKELTREELHEILQRGFGVQNIHAEYGMTELLSQAYSKKNGLFQCPPWMRILLREEDDPFSISEYKGSTGLINVIDLANLYSCSFIATDDIGKMHPCQQFEVLGRMDNSDLRGCSLMVI